MDSSEIPGLENRGSLTAQGQGERMVTFPSATPNPQSLGSK
ncbi:hypothetical protein [Anabaenopsis elenkinii]|nr:hypothetical protein [Anabaenopsis elenkinii]